MVLHLLEWCLKERDIVSRRESLGYNILVYESFKYAVDDIISRPKNKLTIFGCHPLIHDWYLLLFKSQFLLE